MSKDFDKGVDKLHEELIQKEFEEHRETLLDLLKN